MSAQYRINFNKHGEGWVVNETAGENLGIHKLVYRNAAGTWSLADADAVATMPVLGITMGAISSGKKGEILLWGYIGDNITWAWTLAQPIYASTVAGELTQTMPAGIGDVVQVVAMPINDPTMIQFIGSVGAALGGSNTLEGETAFVGFDPSKNHYVNYFLCDGVADDVQIQDAFDYLATLGEGSLMAESGTYDITATIVPTVGNFSLRGQGREATIFKLGANHHLLQLASIDNISIEDMSFDGTKATYDGDLWVGLLTGSVDNLYVDNCDFHDFAGKGAYIRETTNSVFKTSRFYSNTQDGLYLENNGLGNPSQHVSVTSCFAYDNDRVGFNNGEIKDITYIDCQAYSNTEDGWNLEGASDNSYQLENIKLTNCVAYDNTQNGYRIQMECYNIELTSCDAYGNINQGLYLRGHDTYPMRNIKIIGGSYYLNDLNGISMAYGMEYVKIDNVSVYNNDQGDTNNDGISLSNVTAMLNISFNNINAYDDQGAPTQNYGLDFSTVNYDGQNIRISNITGTGNTSSLFRGSGTGLIIPEKWFGVIDPDSIYLGNFPSVVLPDGITTNVFNIIEIPLEFQELVSINAVIVAEGTGNLRRGCYTYWGLLGSEDYDASNDSIALAQIAVTTDKLELITISTAFTGISGGDLVGVQFRRDGGDINDTVNADVHYLGIRIRYV